MEKNRVKQWLTDSRNGYFDIMGFPKNITTDKSNDFFNTEELVKATKDVGFAILPVAGGLGGLLLTTALEVIANSLLQSHLHLAFTPTVITEAVLQGLGTLGGVVGSLEATANRGRRLRREGVK